MIEKIDHIGIVVKDLEKAMKIYSEAFGLETSLVEQMNELNLKLAFIPVSEGMVEFIEPTGPGAYDDFLKEHGEGLHHICFKVTDIDKDLKKVGSVLPLRDKEPRPGGAGSRIAFLEPRSLFNTETELVERK